MCILELVCGNILLFDVLTGLAIYKNKLLTVPIQALVTMENETLHNPCTSTY